jgi:Ca-activated chloride channel family protein
MNEPMENTGLQFGQPLWLVAGLLVCVTVIFFYRKFDRRRQADLAKMAHPRFLPLLFSGDSPVRRLLKRILWVSAVFLLFAALARPQMGYEFREVKRRGIDLLFALDTSHSMLADDLSPNRLDRARMGILDFVDRLEGDRIGLVPFAGSAYALCPLTLDYDAFRESLNIVNTNMIPHQGTDLASAIQEAERLFTENQNNQRILVLITDGEDLQGDVLDSAKKAHENGMVIYTVGVGNPEGSTIPIQFNNSRRDVMRDEKGEIVRTSLDESTLKKIAEVTKGLYVPLGRGAEGLNTIYQEKLRLMPKTDLNQKMEKIPLERFVWPLALAVLLLLVEYFLPDRKRALRQPVVALAILAAVILLPKPLHADERVVYNRGTEAYVRGEFADAVSDLRDALRTPDLSLQQRAYYNLGNALYRQGQAAQEKEPQTTIKHWQESIKAYEDALALDSNDEDARYNRDLVKKKLEQLQQQQEQENQQDQQEKKDKEEQEQKEKEQQQKEQQEKQEQEKKEQEQKSEEEKDQQGEPQEKSEEEKKAEEAQQAKEDQEGKEGESSAAEKAQQPREMTAEEAKQLLESLRHEERRVIPIPQRRDGKTDNTTKGKTW